MTEANVGIDPHERVFVVKHDGADGPEVRSFDWVEERVTLYALNLVIDRPTTVAGTPQAWDTMRSLEERLRQKFAVSGEACMVDLSPQLIGLEGREVYGRALDSTWVRFTVGITGGWLPHHLEVDADGNAKRAAHEYDFIEERER